MASRPHQAYQTPKNTSFTQDFAAMVRDDLRHVNYETRFSGAASVERDNEFRKAFEDEINATLSSSNDLWGAGDLKNSNASTSHTLHNPKDHRMLVEADDILGECRNLIDSYEQLCLVTGSTPSDAAVGADWQQDYKAMAHVLEIGRRVAEEHLQHIVGPAVGAQEMETDEVSKLSKEYKTKAAALLHIGWPDHGHEDSMESILARAERGIKTLTKGLQDVEITS